MSRPKSSMEPEMRNDFVKMAGFPDITFSHIPGPRQTVEDCLEGFVVFFKYPFAETGIAFPIPPLVRSFLEVLGISLGQLMPSDWRILSLISEKTKDWEDPFTLSDLAIGYEIKMAESGFVSLCKKGSTLVLNTDVNDSGWKKWFLFVKRVSLGFKGSWFTEGWPTKELDLGFLESSETSSSNVKKFLAFSPSARTYVRKKKIAGDQSEENQGTPTNTSQQVEDSEETMSTHSAAQGVRRGRSLTQQEADLRIRRKRGLALQEQQPPSAAEKVEPISTLTSLRTVDETGTITLSPSPPRKQQKTDDEPSVPDILGRFPANFLDLRKDDQHSLFPTLNQLLFPKSREVLAGKSVLDIASEAATTHLYCLQNSLVLRDRVIGLAREMKRLDGAAKNSEAQRKTAVNVFQMTKKELDEATKKVDDLESQLKAQSKTMQEETEKFRDQLKEQAKHLEDKIRGIAAKDKALTKVQEELASTKKELEDMLDDYAELDIKVKAKLMMHFLDGKVSEWHPQEVIDCFLANGGTLDELEEDDAVASTADSGPGPSVAVPSSVVAVDTQPLIVGDPSVDVDTQPFIVGDQSVAVGDQPLVAND
ncbi:uncharacterized protein LOC110729970 [Chenopodium quinoa]|uniref:uncharacterized protein LOC110729970 n=1 Tax=Chenopodium quinoa TaxID=63459 RepID=UPI000B79794E|nr:uncharacterized protein LOC110729970 [Chenopodium quinoa]